MALYYHHPEKGVVLENVNFISNDLHHDGHLVRTFTQMLMKHLKESCQYEITVVHRYSDGCAGQFRSRHTMMDVAEFSRDISSQFENCMLIANYGETSEFKNLCDGFGDHVKTPLKNAIVREDLVLDSVIKVFNYLKENMTLEPLQTPRQVLYRRCFYYVDQKDTVRERAGKAVPGLLAVHSAVGIKPGFIGLRNITCYCANCILDWNSRSCENKEYVQDWKVVHVRNEK